MKNETLKNKTDKDLIKKLDDKRKQLQGFRFGVEGSKTKNIREGRNTRREIARILTEMKSRT